ncbi:MULTISPECIES: hypothetical protein [Actinokineospora]|nr:MULTISPECIES: hypothetical protein [Actinokineospora]UVS79505.1 hypothetical protein Actkin_03255 [Actinokineospora sp. UTMC 2448]
MRGGRVLAVIAMIVAMLGAGFGVAAAESGGVAAANGVVAAGKTGRVDACFAGACGSATFTRVNSQYYKPVKMSVKDNKCDGHPVYIQAGVWDITSMTAPTWLPARYNKSGCKGGYAVFNSYIKWKYPIKGLVFRVCVDDAGPNTCRTAH